MSDLDRYHGVQIREAKKHLKRGHKLFDGKDFEGATIEYRKAISYLEWVEMEVEQYYDNRDYLKTIDIMQSLWGWLAKAYREIGEAVEATFCLERENYYIDLEKQCAIRFSEIVNWRKARNKKYLWEIFPIIVGEVTLLVMGIFLTRVFSASILIINLGLVTFSIFVYLVYAINFRRTYSFNHENFERKFRRFPESQRYPMIFFFKHLWLVMVLIVGLIYVILLLSDLVTGSISHSLEDAYLMIILIILMSFLMEALMFWATDFYERKSS